MDVDVISRRNLLTVCTLSAVGACSFNPDQDHKGADAPRAQALKRTPRTAWVFSSGGPRGFVHIGVLKALVQLGLVPDLIVGASAGALVGSLFAAGLPVKDMETLALDLAPMSLLRVAIGTKERLSGSPIAELVRKYAPVACLEQTPIPSACVATRLVDATPVAFTAGDVGLAVQAAAAIEGQFAPVRIRGQQYLDADWTMPLPVRIARALGAQRVLAIDASAHIDRIPPGAENYRASDLRKKALIDTDAALADWVIKPDFGYWVSMSTEFRLRAINAGYQETLRAEAALRAMHR